MGIKISTNKGGKNSKAPFVAGYGAIFLSIAIMAILLILNPSKYQAGVIVPLIGSMVGAGGILISVHAQTAASYRQRAHEQALAHSRAMQELRLQSLNQSKEAYDAFSKIFQQYLFDTEEDTDLGDSRDAIEASRDEIMALKFAMLHYASNETIHEFLNWLQVGKIFGEEGMAKNQNAAAANLIFYARLIRSMRADLGWPILGMDELDILRFFVTDVDNHLERYERAKQWKKAIQIPLE